MDQMVSVVLWAALVGLNHREVTGRAAPGRPAVATLVVWPLTWVAAADQPLRGSARESERSH
ncbi:hypothetical protein ACU635_14485 [[Actinomadura] parvosata]|uniref:hypothetical protein n=1 Tax=[Actinomadura] parvosata TaxID=1955412 RepID=UPI00406CF0AF